MVEFLGLPAAGKTAVCREVAAVLRTRGLAAEVATAPPARSRAAACAVKAWHVVALAVACPRFAAASVAAIARSRPRPYWDGIKIAFNWLYVAGLVQRRPRRSWLTLLDQGMFQALWSLRYFASRPSALVPLDTLTQRVLDRTGAPVTVVVVRAPGDVLASRLDARPNNRSPLDGRGARDFDRAARALVRTLDTVATMTAAGRVAAVIDVENVGPDVTAVAQRLADRLVPAAQLTAVAVAEEA